MKYYLLILALAFTGTLFAQTQTKSAQQKKIEKNFLKQLNDIISNRHPQHHWMTEDPYTIIQPFQIDDHNVLSVTLRYSNDSSWYLHRMQMPMSALTGLTWDLYAVMDANRKDAVTVLESEPGQTKLKEVDRRDIFHVALVEDESIIVNLQNTCRQLVPLYERKTVVR